MDKKANLTLSEVYERYQAPDGGGDKGTAHSYIGIYESEMVKKSGITLLEIGIWHGHSIAMWQEYFDDSRIFGVDVDVSKIQFDLENALLADATKPITALEGSLFDYVIDDGSHEIGDQIRSLSNLWSQIASGGKYFIEDIRGTSELELLVSVLDLAQMNYRVYDNRSLKNRADDILVVIDKE